MHTKKLSREPVLAAEELASGLDPKRYPKLAHASEQFEVARGELDRARQERRRRKSRLERLRAEVAAGLASPAQVIAAEPSARTAARDMVDARERAVRAALKLKSAAADAREALAKGRGAQPAR